MSRSNLEAILKLEAPIIVEIGRTRLPMGEVLSLGPGAIIELPKQADEELELLVNNKPIGSGIAVKVGENFGLKIAFIGEVSERLAALTSGAGSSEDSGESAVSDAEAEALADEMPGGG